MDTYVKCQPVQQPCVSTLSPSSSTSSSSSSSSSHSGVDDQDHVVPPIGACRLSYYGTDLCSILGVKHLGLIDLVDHTGLEWKDVEERFNRLASTGNGITHEPVLRWLDFALCIGMQQCPDFANQLLRVLRKARDWKYDIIKIELCDFWSRMKDDSFQSRMRIFFDLCDRDMDGRISETDMKQTILSSAFLNKLCITQEEAQDYAALIFDLFDKENHGYIEITQLEYLLISSLPKDSNRNRIKHRHIGSDNLYNHNDYREEPMSKVEILFRTYWRRAWIVLIWLLLCSALFTWKFVQYRQRAAFEIMGYCLSTAKGSAETLKLNMALVLLPVCRNTITWLRKNSSVNSFVPFNDNINFHKLIAAGIVVGVILHGGTHLACDFPRISGSDPSIFRKSIANKFGFHQPTYIEILATTEVATGIVMVVLMAIAFSLATKWPRRQSPLLPMSIRRVTGYNTFWYSHHLFILVYAFLIIHSIFLFLTDEMSEKTTWMYIAVPVLLYAGERIFRAVRSGFYEADIVKIDSHAGKVLSIKLQKPEGFKYRSGMYIFIQCPQISPFQWHPYSLTSGPEDDYLNVHIRTLGDWSYHMYSIFQEAEWSRLRNYPKLYIDGPYGAASQDHVKYDIVVLIGLGIGATPFFSILKDVNGRSKEDCDHISSRACKLNKGPLKAYLFWVTREQSSFDWFRDIIKEISSSHEKQSVVEMHSFLTSVYQEGDARSALISIIQAFYHAKNGIDMVSKTPVRTHFGRPNWFNIFSELGRRHRGAKIGVFYCGASALKRELKSLCTKISTETATRFVFHKENY